jgi:hypothetical protein
MAYKRGKRYPEVEGKVVEFAEHSFAEGRLFIRVRFQDKTETVLADRLRPNTSHGRHVRLGDG